MAVAAFGFGTGRAQPGQIVEDADGIRLELDNAAVIGHGLGVLFLAKIENAARGQESPGTLVTNGPAKGETDGAADKAERTASAPKDDAPVPASEEGKS